MCHMWDLHLTGLVTTAAPTLTTYKKHWNKQQEENRAIKSYLGSLVSKVNFIYSVKLHSLIEINFPLPKKNIYIKLANIPM